MCTALAAAAALLATGVRAEDGVAAPQLGEVVVEAERPVSAASSFDFSARTFDLLDLLLRYRWRHWLASLSFYNLTNTAWREAQFADNSCLRGEIGRVPACLARPGLQGTHAAPPADIHFTPGNPITVVAGLTFFF